MTVVSDLVPRSCITAAVSLFLTAFVLTGCSNSNRGVTGNVGVGSDVALATAGDVTQLLEGQNIAVTASVTNDVGGAGVTWSVSPADGSGGTLQSATPTSVTFYAPVSGVLGATSATITATSIARPDEVAAVTIVTSGEAVFNQTSLFPANTNISYAVSLSVSGGTQPFTWVLASNSGPLPPGLTLLGSTTGLSSISGVPTTEGTFSNIIVQATDSSATPVTVSSQPLTLVINAQQTCIISGSWTLLVQGFRGGGGMSHVADITIDNNGVISGEQDYKDGHRTTSNEQLTTASNCTNRQTNSGQIQLVSASGGLLYNFSATPPDTNGVIQSARIQLIGSGSDSASGLMQRVDKTAITPTPPVGNFAFGLLGVINQTPFGVRFATAGRFTTDASGSFSGGLLDSNLAPALTAANLGGSLSAPDALGRGTATLSYGNQNSAFVYYIVNANKMYLMNIDAQNGTTNPRLSGFLTPQVGNAAGGTFDNTAFSGSSILSLWGAISGAEPITIQSLGRLSGSTPTAGSNAGTLNGVVDLSYQANDFPDEVYTAQPYTVGPSGRGTLSLVNGDSAASYGLSFYLDGIGDGYVVQQALPGGPATGGSGGLLEAQYPMPAVGGYPNNFQGYFVGGTQFATAPGPITLTPLASLNFGQLSSNFTNATFYIDPSSGRGLGSLTQQGVTTQPAALYIVSPTKIDLLRFGLRGIDGNIDWLVQNVD